MKLIENSGLDQMKIYKRFPMKLVREARENSKIQ
jgi:hypothetical protein